MSMSALWMETFADGALRAAVLLILAGGVTLFLRQRPAALRHRVWVLALCGAFAVPIAVLLLPAFPVPLPAGLVDSAARNSTIDSGSALLQPVAHDLQSAGPPPGTEASGPPQFSWQTGALLIWFIGLTLVGTRSAQALWRANRLARAARPVDSEDWLRDLKTVSSELDLGRPVEIRRSSSVAVPMTLGWLRPVVLIPTETTDWSRERRVVVLRHELSHVKRGDCLTELLGQAACAYYWFNPVTWIAARRLRIEREHACDDLVLALGTKASAYARHLVQIASSAPPNHAVAATGISMVRPSQLESRVVAILDSRARHVTTQAAGRVLTGLVFTIALVVSAVTPAAQAVAEKPVDGRLETEVTILEVVEAAVEADEIEAEAEPQRDDVERDRRRRDLRRVQDEIEDVKRRLQVDTDRDLRRVQAEVEQTRRRLEDNVERVRAEVELERERIQRRVERSEQRIRQEEMRLRELTDEMARDIRRAQEDLAARVYRQALEGVVEAITQLGDDEAAEALIRLMDSQNDAVRQAVIEALREASTRKSITPAPTPQVFLLPQPPATPTTPDVLIVPTPAQPARQPNILVVPQAPDPNILVIPPVPPAPLEPPTRNREQTVINPPTGTASPSRSPASPRPLAAGTPVTSTRPAGRQ